MPTKKAIRLLGIGCRTEFCPLFDELEATGNYEIAYSESPLPADFHPERKPEAILLYVPDEMQEAAEALAWVARLKREAPVVVVSRAAEMGPYMSAMTYGAFDYITCYTPFPEVQRILSAASHWQRRRAA